MIIPLGAGGGGDIFTRALADELQKALRPPVVVENRTGGALNIGARACAEAAPDGYTICVLSSEPVIYNQFVFKSLPFDPEKDFEPISNLFFNTLALVANSSLKVQTIADLVALSKARPGTLSYGTFSFPLAYFMEKLKTETGADIVRVAVPEKKDTAALKEILPRVLRSPAIFSAIRRAANNSQSRGRACMPTGSIFLTPSQRCGLPDRKLS